MFIQLCSVPTFSKTITVPVDYSTIQSAIDNAVKGDTVLVNPGSYHEFIVLRDSIVLMSSGVDDGNWNRASATIIHSEGLRDSDDNITPVVNCADGAVLDGFEITGMDTVNHHLPGHSHAVQNRGTSSTIKNCIVHDNGSTGIGSHEKDGRSAVPTIIHNKVYRNFGIGIGFNHFSRGVAKDNTVYENREVGIGVQNGAAPLIENNNVYGNGWNGISVREGSKPTIKNNTIYSNGTDRTGAEMPPGAGVGIGADSTGWLVKPGEEIGPMIVENNIIYDNPSGGIMARNNSLLNLKGNSCYDNFNFQIAINDSSVASIDSNFIYQTSESNYQAGGLVVNRNSIAKIKNNNIYNTDLAALIVGNKSSAEIINNDIYLNLGVGIRIDSTDSTILVKENRLINNKSQGILLANCNTVICKNLLVNNSNGGITCDSQSVSHIYNNTIFNNADTAGRGIVAAHNDSKITNNIVCGYSVGIFKSYNPYIDYNCTFNNKNAYNGPPATGGSNAIAADPKFVDIDKEDFHLKSSSPCINKGNPDPVYNDTDSSRSDMGCYPFSIINSINYTEENTLCGLTVYPYIANNILNISITPASMQAGNVIIEIYDMLCNKVSEQRIENLFTALDTSTFSLGTYFLRSNISGCSKGIVFFKI